MEVGTSRTDARLTVGRTNRRWAKKNRNRWSGWSDYYEIPIKYPCELLRPMSWPSQLWHRCISAESRWCRGISQSRDGPQGSRRPCARCSRCSIKGVICTGSNPCMLFVLHAISHAVACYFRRARARFCLHGSSGTSYSNGDLSPKLQMLQMWSWSR